MVRHYFYAGTVAACPPRMHHAATMAQLIASGSSATSLPSNAPRTATAINLAAVALAADQNLNAAACAQEKSGGRTSRTNNARRCKVDWLRNRCDTALVIVLSTVQGTAPSWTCRF